MVEAFLTPPFQILDFIDKEIVRLDHISGASYRAFFEFYQSPGTKDSINTTQVFVETRSIIRLTNNQYPILI